MAISYWQFKRQTDPIYKWCQRRSELWGNHCRTKYSTIPKYNLQGKELFVRNVCIQLNCSCSCSSMRYFFATDSPRWSLRNRYCFMAGIDCRFIEDRTTWRPMLYLLHLHKLCICVQKITNNNKFQEPRAFLEPTLKFFQHIILAPRPNYAKVSFHAVLVSLHVLSIFKSCLFLNLILKRSHNFIISLPFLHCKLLLSFHVIC